MKKRPCSVAKLQLRGGLDKDLTFRVEQLGPGYYGETLRAMSLNGSINLGRAAFGAAMKHYPNQRWITEVGRLHRRKARSAWNEQGQ
jgi:hypothetical protein